MLIEVQASFKTYCDIPDNAFKNSIIEEIIIPEGVRTIGQKAFKNCKFLEKVQLPSTLKLIDKNAFEGCTSLCSIHIPYGVETIEKEAFWGCTRLCVVNIPSTIRTICSRAFGQTALYEVAIPLSGVSIKDDAFQMNNAFCYCADSSEEALEYAKLVGTRVLVIAEGVTEIKDNTFTGWESLNTIVIPSTLQRIEQNAFADKLGHYTVISKIRDLHKLASVEDLGLYYTDTFVDEDTGDPVIINCSFIKNLFVPEGCTDQYRDLDIFGCKVSYTTISEFTL